MKGGRRLGLRELMETTHRVVVGDARDMDAISTDSVHLVVTSPPYPMIEMWDEMFAELDPSIASSLEAGEGTQAFEAMHRLLDGVWEEVQRVLVPGGIACINIGDATRSIGGRFRVFPNHARVLDALQALGLEPLPPIMWRKPTNSAAKFMGSGMLPPNAYATLEHEHILLLRNGSKRRSFAPGAEDRYQAAYFWEERNQWFTDLWTDIRGTLQAMDEEDELRQRSAAFPFEVPFRLVSMFSTYGDTVLDPFWGTGTTSLAAGCAARNSIGYERQEAFVAAFGERSGQAPKMSREVVSRRLRRHRAFLEERRQQGDPPGHESEHYGFGVMTKQERRIRFYVAQEVEEREGATVIEHEPVEQAAPWLIDGPIDVA